MPNEEVDRYFMEKKKKCLKESQKKWENRSKFKDLNKNITTGRKGQ